MAPEIILGETNSIGGQTCMAWLRRVYLLTGHSSSRVTADEGDAATRAGRAVSSVAANRAADSKGIDDLVLACLRKDPNHTAAERRSDARDGVRVQYVRLWNSNLAKSWWENTCPNTRAPSRSATQSGSHRHATLCCNRPAFALRASALQGGSCKIVTRA